MGLLTLYYGTTMALSSLAFWLYSPLLQSLSFGAEKISLLYAAYNLAAVAGSFLVGTIDKWMSVRASFLLMPALLAMSSLAMAGRLFPVLIIAPLAIQMTRGAAQPLVRSHLTQLLSPSERATILSVGNMLQRLGFVVLSPALGLIVDRLGSGRAFFLLGMLAIVPGLLFIRPNKIGIPAEQEFGA